MEFRLYKPVTQVKETKMTKMIVRIDWKIKFGNEPEITLHGLEDKDFGFVYEGIVISPSHTIWLAKSVCGNFATGLIHNNTHEEGFGGQTFTLPTKTGNVNVKGPWSGSSATYNPYLSDKVTEVSINGHGFGIMIKKDLLASIMPEGTYLTKEGEARMIGTSEDEEGLYASKTMNGGVYKKVKNSTCSYWVWDYDKEKEMLAVAEEDDLYYGTYTTECTVCKTLFTAYSEDETVCAVCNHYPFGN